MVAEGKVTGYWLVAWSTVVGPVVRLTAPVKRPSGNGAAADGAVRCGAEKHSPALPRPATMRAMFRHDASSPALVAGAVVLPFSALAADALPGGARR
ncbi:hypothetical protein BCD48_33690 [Pseudofrankia sp. BMG5.36]|nr:hypothetical protein BCD48_33690 [Pseudofrankia sp. BMG5.36]